MKEEQTAPISEWLEELVRELMGAVLSCVLTPALQEANPVSKLGSLGLELCSLYTGVSCAGVRPQDKELFFSSVCSQDHMPARRLRGRSPQVSCAPGIVTVPYRRLVLSRGDPASPDTRRAGRLLLFPQGPEAPNSPKML